ncbi:MAG: NUDIX domain-containing protein [Anaerolineales bacterium]|nr:NUDIX domain-containing protein [Anaerolineales bacterium]
MLLNMVCLPVKKQDGIITEVLLARKKIGFGAGKIVGVGGTVEPGETLFQTVVREVNEEISLQIKEGDLERAAKITFTFPSKPEWDRLVYVYLVEDWVGIPQSSNEVDPFWVPVEEIPYHQMWADSAEWLPVVLSGRRIVARFSFEDDNESLAFQEIDEDKDFLWPQIKSLPWFRALLRSVEASYYQDLDFPEPVLDLGSGDGHFADAAFDFTINVGLDPWWGPLAASKKYPHAYGGRVQADGAEMPFPDGYFASALSNSVLEHIPHLDEVLAETARVLKTGAPFVFCCPNPGHFSELSISGGLQKLGLKKLADWYQEWFRRISRTEHADRPEVWETRLEKSGFTLDRWWHYFPPESMRVLEWGHYLGAPSLLPKWLLGRWLISGSDWNLALIEKVLRPFAQTEPHPLGTYTFYIARRK